jgi:lipoprotein-releasing system permease protein
LLEQIEGVKGVKLAFPERQSLGMIYSPLGSTWAQIRGVPSDVYMRDEGLRTYLKILSGTFDLSQPENVLLGKTIAEKIGVKVGDTVKLLTVIRIGQRRFAPKLTSFMVKGIISSGYQDLDKLWVYIPYDVGSQIMPESTSNEFIAIKVADPFGDMNSQVDEIYHALPPAWNLARINSWYELEENQYKSFQTTKILLIFIMCIIVLVAIVNVFSTMVMVVMEKIQEIGILKSIGSSPGMISSAFLITGFLTGVMGTILGLTSGLLVAININFLIKKIEVVLSLLTQFVNYLTKPLMNWEFASSVKLLDPAYYLENIPIRLEWFEIFIIAFSTIFLSTIASFIPARRAGRIRPLDVMRKV